MTSIPTQTVISSAQLLVLGSTTHIGKTREAGYSISPCYVDRDCTSGMRTDSPSKHISNYTLEVQHDVVKNFSSKAKLNTTHNGILIINLCP